MVQVKENGNVDLLFFVDLEVVDGEVMRGLLLNWTRTIKQAPRVVECHWNPLGRISHDDDT